MKGKYQVIVWNSFVRYEFEIRRNITIIQGDSATGKTTLVELIREFYEDGESSGVGLRCERECAVLSGRDWQPLLETMHNRIIFIDEGNSFVRSETFASAVKNSDNYYVIVSREGLENLPYSVTEVYGIRESGKYASLKQTYNEFFHIYGRRNYSDSVRPTAILVEDANAGFEFFKGVSEKKGWNVVSAKGKSNIFSQMLAFHDEEKLLVIADGAAFGPEMNRVMKLVRERENVILYLPESFEWLILSSGIIDGKEIARILDTPQDYIESEKYFSWERFFEALLVEYTQGGFLQYSKYKLNPAYLSGRVKKRICTVIKGIELID